MGVLGKVKKGVKKGAKKAKKTTKKGAKTVSKSVKKGANEVRKGTEKAVKKTVKSVGTAFDEVADFTVSMSKETEKLAKDIAKELEKVGENIAEALQGLLWDQVVRLAKAMLKDILKTVEDVADTARRLADSPEQMQTIGRLISDLERGKLRGDTARRQVIEVMENIALGNPGGFRTKSVGVQADAAYYGGVGGGAGVAIDQKEQKEFLKGKRALKDVSVRRYLGACGSLGMSGGASAGLEIGFWVDQPKNLDGEFIGVSLGVAQKAGIEVGMYFSYKLRFLGFNVVPTTGSEVEVGLATGKTKTFKIL